MVAALKGEWQGTQQSSSPKYGCGHCGTEVGSSKRYLFKSSTADEPDGHLFICPICNRPTYVLGDFEEQVPGPLAGRTIKGITDVDVENLYDEARKALANGAPSAAVLVCRKLLMHMAVVKGAEENQGFTYYADYISDEHIVGEPFSGVVAHIKDQGNKENHELDVSSVAEATMLLRMVEFVLASIYELPGMVPAPESAPEQSS